jgi:predicted DCC family thiol-disulfide oxidoreductase YuxK
MIPNASRLQAATITLLYDGQCPMCSREVRLLRRLDRGRGRIGFEDITAATFAPESHGVTMEQVVGSMHAVRADGSIVRGMQVFREAYAAVGSPLAWLLALTGWPVLRPMFDGLYRVFARVRRRLSPFNPECSDGRCSIARSTQS